MHWKSFVSEKPRILIVDDEASVREFCRRALSAFSLEMQTASNGTEAFTQCKAGTFDVVITDLVMPGGIDGRALLEEIKRLSPVTDVIIMTAFPALESAIPTLKQGAYDYLTKPLDMDLLRSVLARCLEKRRLSEELQREKALRRELEAAYAELKDMEQIKEAFLARINHELRAPLAPAFLAVDLLCRVVKDPKALDLCSLLQQRLNDMQNLVESLLLFSELRKHDFAFMKTPVHLKDLLTALIDRFRTEWLDRQISIELQVDPDAEMLSADPELMETALKQLLLNAIRFNRKGGGVAIQARRKGSQVEILFEDTGIGIPENKISNALSGFYQVAHYLTREMGGLGLGLALVKRIVDVLGGSIHVESREGQGSRFTLALPAEPIPEAALVCHPPQSLAGDPPRSITAVGFPANDRGE